MQERICVPLPTKPTSPHTAHKWRGTRRSSNRWDGLRAHWVRGWTALGWACRTRWATWTSVSPRHAWRGRRSCPPRARPLTPHILRSRRLHEGRARQGQGGAARHGDVHRVNSVHRWRRTPRGARLGVVRRDIARCVARPLPRSTARASRRRHNTCPPTSTSSRATRSSGVCSPLIATFLVQGTTRRSRLEGTLQ